MCVVVFALCVCVCVHVGVCLSVYECVRHKERERVGMKVRFCSETFDVEEQRLLSVCQLPTLYHHPNTWPLQSVCVSVCLYMCVHVYVYVCKWPD